MTLPIDILLPLPQDFPSKDPNDYLQMLVRSLRTMYQSVSNNVNGSIRNDAQEDSSQWIPEIFGESTSGTTTYVHKYGWSLRTGILTDVWFDVSWSATTATGNLYIELPYIVAISNGKPFVGIAHPSSITLSSGYAQLGCNALPNSYNLEIWQSGNGKENINLPVPASGRILGNCRYIGIEDV